MLDAFRENLIADSVWVYPPKRYVLLCGGEVSHISVITPISLRDAFLKGSGFSALKDSEVLQIEEIQEFFEKTSPYTDLVEFEKDIAQICELVLLFSESPGSFAELGSFSVINEISEKLLVVIRNKYSLRPSFISKGLLESLRRKHPESVFTIIDTQVGIKGDQLFEVNCSNLVEVLQKPVESRLSKIDHKRDLDRGKFNHLCKVYVGLLNEFYCLSSDEIILLLTEIGFSIDEEGLERVAFCCVALKWASSTFVGFERIHYALQGDREAAKFEFKKPLADKIRRRAKFREYWKDYDPARIDAVDQELS